MQASDFEFRQRWWVFGGICGVAFLPAIFDHVPVAQRIADRLVAAGAGTERQALHGVLGLATLIMLMAALLRTWGSAYLRREVVHDHAVHGEVLHADGPYRHVRNPLYLGNALMAVAVGLMAPVAGYPLLIIGMIVFCYRLIGREEAVLAAEQDQRFAAYTRAVPRLWPSLRARVAPGGGVPDWRSGWAAEAFFWTYAVGMALLALTLNAVWFFASLLASPMVSALAGVAMRHRDASH